MPRIAPGQREFQFRDDASPAAAEKVCTKCGLSKSDRDYYVKDRKTGRLYSWCKPCHNRMVRENARETYAADPEKGQERVRAWREANPEKFKEISRRSRKKNIAKVRERERAYKAANPEKIRAKKERYRKRRKEVVNAGHARYREAHHEELRARHKAWRDAHPERSREILDGIKHRRRARLAGNGGDHTAAEWATVKANFGHACYLCGRKEPEIKLTRDHFIPISKGGDNNISNILPACKSCNSRKHAKMPAVRRPDPPA